MMKNLGILILECFFLSLTFLWEVRQGIRRSISHSLTVFNSKMVSRELLGPADLTRAQAFHIYKSTEVIMVSENKDLVFAAF